MKKTVKTIFLSVAFLTGAGMANAQNTEVVVDIGLQTALSLKLECFFERILILLKNSLYC